MMSTPNTGFRKLFEELGRGYAWVALLPSASAGIPLALLTFVAPWPGILGLLSALSAWYAGKLAGADSSERPVCIFNGLLIGLLIGHMWIPGYAGAALSLFSGIFCGWLAVTLGRWIWAISGLPILSLPFALASMVTIAAAGRLPALTPQAWQAAQALFGGPLDAFFRALGNLYLLSNPLYGVLVFVVMALLSRYYLLLAIAGYAAAALWLSLLGAGPELAATAWGSNAILAALLVGGLFATPSRRSAVLAVLAALFSAWLCVGLGAVLDVLHLPPFSAPFVAASWLVLYAALRNPELAASFHPLRPDVPERSLERAQLSRARLGEAGSVGLTVPFDGEWTVSQGFSGAHTHRGPWRHALDFIVLRDGRSFSGRGDRLQDFHCYDQAVFSPCHGQVWRVVNDIADNQPGKVNAEANWGNHVLLRLASGRFVLVAHLRQWSIVAIPGAWLKPGDLLGHCGNSGRSPQPHIHLHVQDTERLGAPTSPFHLASVLLAEGEAPARYELAVVPQEQSRVCAAVSGEVRPFYLYAGRGIRYEVSRDGHPLGEWSLQCQVDDSGALVLVSGTGARVCAESTWAVFSGYARSHGRDRLLDLWLLACSYCPASFQIERWEDRALPARLLPGWLQRLYAATAWPWMSFVHSHHQRRWDAQAQGWRQIGEHGQRPRRVALRTEALILPQKGCTYLSAQTAGGLYTLRATRIFQLADVGVPAWEEEIRLSHLPARSC